MFDLIKSVVWIAGILVVSYIIMNYFGYTVNLNYFSISKQACQEKIKDCSDNLIRNGLDNVQCDINCVDPGLIIKKK